MASESSSSNTELTPIDVMEQIRIHGWSWRTRGAVFGLGCGIISPLIGLVLTIIAWFSGPEWHGLSLHRDGTVLIILTIPLLIFGAHCLDLMDKQDQKASKTRSQLD